MCRFHCKISFDMESTTNFITASCWRCRPLLISINFLLERDGCRTCAPISQKKKKKKAMVVNKSRSLSKAEAVIEQQLSLELWSISINDMLVNMLLVFCHTPCKRTLVKISKPQHISHCFILPAALVHQYVQAIQPLFYQSLCTYWNRSTRYTSSTFCVCLSGVGVNCACVPHSAMPWNSMSQCDCVNSCRYCWLFTSKYSKLLL